MATVEIYATEKVFSRLPGRQGMVDRVLLYHVDSEPGRTLFATMPDEAYTPEAAQAAVRKAEAERKLSSPLKFTV